jgi:hypothetical protein
MSSDNTNVSSENNNINNTINITDAQSTDYLYNILTNPSLLIILSIIVLLFYFLFASLGNSNNVDNVNSSSQSTSGLAFLEVILWGTFFLLIFINSAVYFYEFDITAGVNNLFQKDPQIDINVTTPSSSLSDSNTASDSSSSSVGSKEVFHIPGNDYVYEDAKALCGAYNSRLANYNEVEDAYNKGAEWCSYGWSDGQMALFPTQKATYEELQKIPGHENDCGRPGINGGYISNKAVRFGVNCFGYKPKITPLEREIMNNSEKYPKTLKDLQLEKRTNYWKDHIKNIMLSPFNSTSWSRI